MLWTRDSDLWSGHVQSIASWEGFGGPVNIKVRKLRGNLFAQSLFQHGSLLYAACCQFKMLEERCVILLRPCLDSILSITFCLDARIVKRSTISCKLTLPVCGNSIEYLYLFP